MVSEDIVNNKSPLEKERQAFNPELPAILSDITQVAMEEGLPSSAMDDVEALAKLFPHTFGRPEVHFVQGASSSAEPLIVGVVLSGGQAAGGHNVITGLFDALKKLNPQNRLLGFLGGPSGVVSNSWRELTQELLADYRNTGGFDLIGSGRAKIETAEQLSACLQVMQELRLDGLVNIGGDDSNTNTAILAEYFLANGCQTKVVGVPKTIDGDLKNHKVEISFGFDTAAKIYSELIGNIARDAFSAKKYYHFVKLMGRSASHITLECALQTHPNVALIGEEIAAKGLTLEQIADEIADVIVARAQAGKNFGVVLVPEGLIGFVPEVKQLIKELNYSLAHKSPEQAVGDLSIEARATFQSLPQQIGEQLLIDRDPHGNVQVAHIETEKLLIQLVKEKLKNRTEYSGKFKALSHYFGYEGRSGFPSNFDATYSNALGQVSATLIHGGFSGYMAYVGNLTQPITGWCAGGIPITSLMKIEERKGRAKAVIQISLVDLDGEPFTFFAEQRENWAKVDEYRYPGPIQFSPNSLANQTTLTLQLERGKKIEVTA